MNDTNKSAESQIPTTIGVVLGKFPGEEDIGTVVKYLLAEANRRQAMFTFEIFDGDAAKLDEIAKIKGSAATVEAATDYVVFLKNAQRKAAQGYRIQTALPEKWILVASATRSDNWYRVRAENSDVQILTFGAWASQMAPPSAVEAIVSLIISSALLAEVPDPGRHIGTTGCVGDFCPSLENVRHKVLAPHVCTNCRTQLTTRGFSKQQVDSIQSTLEMRWIGDPADPVSVAATVYRFGHRLYQVSGWELNCSEQWTATVAPFLMTKLFELLIALLLAILVAQQGCR